MLIVYHIDQVTPKDGRSLYRIDAVSVQNATIGGFLNLPLVNYYTTDSIIGTFPKYEKNMVLVGRIKQ